MFLISLWKCFTTPFSFPFTTNCLRWTFAWCAVTSISCSKSCSHFQSSAFIWDTAISDCLTFCWAALVWDFDSKSMIFRWVQISTMVFRKLRPCHETRMVTLKTVFVLQNKYSPPRKTLQVAFIPQKFTTHTYTVHNMWCASKINTITQHMRQGDDKSSALLLYLSQCPS